MTGLLLPPPAASTRNSQRPSRNFARSSAFRRSSISPPCRVSARLRTTRPAPGLPPRISLGVPPSGGLQLPHPAASTRDSKRPARLPDSLPEFRSEFRLQAVFNFPPLPPQRATPNDPPGSRTPSQNLLGVPPSGGLQFSPAAASTRDSKRPSQNFARSSAFRRSSTPPPAASTRVSERPAQPFAQNFVRSSAFRRSSIPLPAAYTRGTPNDPPRICSEFRLQAVFNSPPCRVSARLPTTLPEFRSEFRLQRTTSKLSAASNP